MMVDVLEALAALGPRLAGTGAAKRASELVAEALSAVGAVVTLERISYEGWAYGDAPSVAMIVPEYLEVPASPMPFAPASGGVVDGVVSVLEAPIVLAGIPFSPVFFVSGASRRARLLVAGSDVPFPLPAFDGQSLPSAVVGRRDGELILDVLKRGIDVRLCVQTFGAPVAAEDVNVVGVLDGDESRTIAVTSHYDSAWRSPGASDNAAGVAMMVDLARRMRSYNLENRFEFISFGAEELGLRGSRSFVESAAAQKRLHQYLAVVNLDPGLGPNRSLQCEVGPDWLKRDAGTVAAELSLPFLPVDPGGAVDSTPFWEVGVPVCCPQFLPSPPWFHLPEDLPRNVDWGQLERVLDFSEALLRRLARQPLRP